MSAICHSLHLVRSITAVLPWGLWPAWRHRLTLRGLWGSEVINMMLACDGDGACVLGILFKCIYPCTHTPFNFTALKVDMKFSS
jgi:hypothetical protein